MNRPRLIRGLRIAWSGMWDFFLCIFIFLAWIIIDGLDFWADVSRRFNVPTPLIHAILWISCSIGIIAILLWRFDIIQYPVRFSLRTLLIATTLIAVVLGLVMWSKRSRPMERTKVVRGLRIAWSVWWGTLCVLLVVFWVRSYSVIDTFKPFAHDETFVVTEPGAFGIAAMPSGYGAWWSSEPTPQWIKGREVDSNNYSRLVGILEVSPLGFLLPFWFAVLLLTVIGAASWIPWSKHFSLRTMLIVITIIAVVLGLVMWAMR